MVRSGGQPAAALPITCTSVFRAAWLYNDSSFMLRAQSQTFDVLSSSSHLVLFSRLLARKAVRRAVEAARSSWVDSVLAVVNADGTVNSADGKPISPQAALHAIRALQRGPRLVEEVFEAAERSNWRKPGPV